MDISSTIDSVKAIDSASKTIWTVWLLSAFGYVARGIPGVIWTILKQSLTTTIYAIDDGASKRSDFFDALEKFISLRHKPSNSNTITFRIVNGVKHNAPGPGWGWFFLKGVLIVFKKVVETQTAGNWNGNTQTITVRIFTKNKEKLASILNEIHCDTPRRTFNSYSADCGWSEIAPIRDTREVFLDKDLKATIDKAVDFFKDNKQWYLDRGLPWKLTIMLHGQPGTGKTSIIRYIADRVNASIYQSSLIGMGKDMRGAVISVPEMSVLAIEDFDDCAGIQSRTESEVTVEATGRNVGNTKKSEGLLSQFLNTFQGLVPLHGQITVLTTNHPEKIDKAAIREGRVDLCLEVGLMKPEQIKQFIQKNFAVELTYTGPCYGAAHVANCFSNNPTSFKDFISDLSKGESHV